MSMNRWARLGLVALTIGALLISPAGGAARARADQLPGTGDYVLAIPPDWTSYPLPQDSDVWRELGIFGAPARFGNGVPVATIYVRARQATTGGWDAAPQLGIVVFEYGLGCTLDGVSGSDCVHIVGGSTNGVGRIDGFGIIKNGVAWLVFVLAETHYFDQNRPALERVLLSFHTDFGAPAPRSPSCVFQGGFKTLHDLIPDIVGDCRDNEHRDADSGNIVQRTRNGLLVYQPSTNLSWFSDGSTTWILGPCGLQKRRSWERFSWEAGEPGCDLAGASTAPPSPPPTPSLPPQPTGPLIPHELEPAWRALQSLRRGRPDLPTVGELAQSWLAETGAHIQVASLPTGVGGVYAPDTNTVTIATAITADIPAVGGAVLVHELAHAEQQLHGVPSDCVPREVDALNWQGIAWSQLTGGAGVRSPSSAEQANEDLVLAVLVTDGEPGLYKLVVDNPDYQQECHLWTPS